MTQNCSSREFHTKIDQYLTQLEREGRGGNYLVYVIKDPSMISSDWSDGTPFYVGQTSDLRRRAHQHLRRGGASPFGGSALMKRIFKILSQKSLPIFGVLEHLDDRLAALEAERKWAVRLNQNGCRLLNQWAEHKSDTKTKLYSDGTKIPTKRLWSLTLAEADDVGIHLEVNCRRCSTNFELPLADIIKRSKSTLALFTIRSQLVCPDCGAGNCLRIVRNAVDR